MRSPSRTSRAMVSQVPSLRPQLLQRQLVHQVPLPQAASTSRASRESGVRSGATATTQATSTRTQTRSPFEDKQSDGKPGSFLQAPASPAPAGAPGPATPSRFNLEGFKGEWREEWRNGNYPGYKHTNPDAIPFEDRQSDGKPGSFLQAPASPAPAG